MYPKVLIITVALLVCFALNIYAAEPLSERLLQNNFHLLSSPVQAGSMVLQDIKGRSINPAHLKGKVVLLNFWKIDCPPCSVEKPILERIQKKFGQRGLEVICVNLFDDPEKTKQYLQKTGFSFFAGYDPTNKLKVKKQQLSRGTTNFVINEKSEAVFEVPGVPTTYVINKHGKVIGNSAGLINWEEEPFDELLRQLLDIPGGPTKQVGFNTAARQGGPVSNPKADQSVNQSQLPFSESGLQQTMSAPSTGERNETGHKSAIRKKSVIKKKDELPHLEPTGERRPDTPPKNLKSTKAAQSKKPPQPAVTVAGSELSASGLPPALPYTPPGKQPVSSAAPVTPDETGTIMARIPESAQQQQSRPLLHPSSAPANLPAARPISGNAIDGFILDSFKQSPQSSASQAQAETAASQQGAQSPQSSVIGQLGEDFKNLGSGIRETFSRIFPAR